MLFWKRVSPARTMGWSSLTVMQTLPGVWPGVVNDTRLNGACVHAVAIDEEAIDLRHFGRLEGYAKCVELHLYALVEKQIVFVDHRRCVGRFLHFSRRAHVVKMGMRVNDRSPCTQALAL